LQFIAANSKFLLWLEELSMYAEYAGLTHEAVTLIERLRKFPSESKSDILIRVLAQLIDLSPNVGVAPVEAKRFNLGQGASLKVGEKIFLYLSKAAKRADRPDGIAEVGADGLHMDGHRVRASRGNPLQAAMRAIQEKKGHRNEVGQIISLSAWRQWHVIRDGKLVPVFELKDPALAHTRSRVLGSRVTNLTLDELGL
jgi:hypothetical protein